jgi:peptidoglycan/xylan/chitin deacetylase (PgdA/CDA1 family)
MFKTLFALRAPAGPNSPLSVLIFHRVLPGPDPLFPLQMHARQFDAVCGWLARWFKVLALDEAVAHLKAGTLPARAACLTFDDGYADNLQVALPILQRHGLKATCFVATGFLDGGRMWNDTVLEAVRVCNRSVLDLSDLPGLGVGPLPLGTLVQKRQAVATLINALKYRSPLERLTLTEAMAHLARVALPTHLMLSSNQVKAWRQAGMLVGAHTVSHPILATVSHAESYQEIAHSKHTLERLLDEPVGLFAYPNGKPGEDYTVHNAAQVRRLGFTAAFSTQAGAAKMGDDVYQLPRFTPWQPDPLRFAASLWANMAARR